MKVMITGANGTIGTDLVDQFSKNNEVFAFYRTYNLAVKKIKNKNTKWIRQDLKNEIKNNFKPDVIIHLAAQAGVRYSLNNPRAYIDSNIVGTFNIMEVARLQKVKHLLMGIDQSY